MHTETPVRERLFVGIASGDACIEEVSSLVTRVYSKEGYIDPETETASSITTFLGKPHTVTFEARLGTQLLGTISIAADSTEGLPMDCIYEDELSPYREQQSKIGEVCQFIVDKDLIREMLGDSTADISETDISVALLGSAIHHGIAHAFDHFVFTINPKHRVLYESLGCLQIGDERSYPSVNEAPALAYALDIPALREAAQSGKVTNMLLRKIFATS